MSLRPRRNRRSEPLGVRLGRGAASSPRLVGTSLASGLALLSYLLITATTLLAGWLLTGGALSADTNTFDAAVIDWVVDHRTAGLDRATAWVSSAADTVVVVPAAALALAILGRRCWDRAILLASALAVEWTAFLTAVTITGRLRPASRLDPAPLTSSFPSGHTSGAVAFYGGLALVVATSLPHRTHRRLALTAGALVALAIGVARVYRGMHYPTDVLWGLVLGSAALLTGWLAHDIARSAARARPAERRRSEPD